MQFLGQPLPNVHIRTLRDAYSAYNTTGELLAFLEVIREVQQQTGIVDLGSSSKSQVINADDLHLVCFDYVWS